MIVVDASVVVDVLCNAGSTPDVRRRLAGEVLLAPDLLPIEVASALRGLNRGGEIDDAALDTAVIDLSRLRVDLHPTLPLLPRILALRQNVTAYDAAYVALASVVGCSLITYDRRLARAAVGHCAVEIPGLAP